MIGYKTIFRKLKNAFFQAKKKNLAAFTLIEILVSVTLFSGIILISTSLFKLSIDAQRNAIATQNVQESLRYFLEMIAKEMRMAKKNNNSCAAIPYGEVFYLSSGIDGDVLSFKNYYNDCVEYSIGIDAEGRRRFKVKRISPIMAVNEGYISPTKIEVQDLNFSLNTDNSSNQSMVTVSIKAKAIQDDDLESELILQTSITSRYYKEI